MKLKFWSVGKAHEHYVKEGTDAFTKRISNYFAVEWAIVAPPKNAGALQPADLKTREGELLLAMLKKDDFLVLLDERGKQFTSEGFATFLQQRANDADKNIVFLIGGVYGVSTALMKRANHTWSLSQLVLPHQLVRLVLAEQVYRACSILRNEKYHHV